MTPRFTPAEVDGLRERFSKMCDGDARGLTLASFSTAVGMRASSPYAQRLFGRFDKNHDGIVSFDEWLAALCVFRPDASLDAKIDFSFELFADPQTGAVERAGVAVLLTALPALQDLPAAAIEMLVDSTMRDFDLSGRGAICSADYRKVMVGRPDYLGFMTLPLLSSERRLFRALSSFGGFTSPTAAEAAAKALADADSEEEEEEEEEEELEDITDVVTGAADLAQEAPAGHADWPQVAGWRGGLAAEPGQRTSLQHARSLPTMRFALRAPEQLPEHRFNVR